MDVVTLVQCNGREAGFSTAHHTLRLREAPVEKTPPSDGDSRRDDCASDGIFGFFALTKKTEGRWDSAAPFGFL
jgi:hypothetical protein